LLPDDVEKEYEQVPAVTKVAGKSKLKQLVNMMIKLSFG
jgi:hypothetical protein